MHEPPASPPDLPRWRQVLLDLLLTTLAEATRLARAFDDQGTLESRARFIAERLALALQASLLIRAGNSHVSDTFCESRLAGAHGQTFGTLPGHAPFHALIQRAFAE